MDAYHHKVVDWPADPWGNPYVLYLLYLRDDGTYSFILSPTQEPDFFCAVVSYGPNRVPGGPETLTPQERDRYKALRLYTETNVQGAQYRLLLLDEYFSNNCASAYSQPFGPGSIGIVDEGSDDIFFEF